MILDSADRTYYEKLAFKIAMIFLIIGGLNWLLVGIFDVDIITSVFGKGTLSSILFILVGLSALGVMFNRDTYLPFLGPMVAPCSVLQDRFPPGATREVIIHVKPNSKVLYWASEPASAKLEKVNNWKDAYLKYENAGVATSNSDGTVILKVRDPQPYNVPIKGRLEPHIHYRVCGQDGWMDKIQTVFVNSKIEGFESKTLDKKYKFDISDTSASIY